MTTEIDIDRIIRSKNPRLAKLLPKFIKNYLKRAIHQDEINYCLRTFSDKKGIEFVRAVLRWLEISSNVSGAENIERQKRYIFACNHPLGGLDGMVLADQLERIAGDTKLIVNDLLMNLAPLESLFVPINKHGGQTSGYARVLNDLYDSQTQIITFPAGLCSRKIRGRIQDPPWKKNFIVKAVEHKRDVVPVYVEARNSNFFYNFALIRKMLGIKSNIEMFYLPREMFRKRGSHVRLIIGKPIPYQQFTKEKSAVQWAEHVRNIVYRLK